MDRVQRFVLLAIGDNAGDDGFCWPSISTLASKTLFTTRYVMDAIQKLEADGWIKVERRSRDGKGNEYFIDVEKLETLKDEKRLREKSSRMRHPVSSEQSSREKPSSEQSSREIYNTTQVNSVADSGEIHDNAYKEEPSGTVKGIVRVNHFPCSPGSDGEFMAATWLGEELSIAFMRSELPVVAKVIQFEARDRGGGDAQIGAEFIRDEGLRAKAAGDRVDFWWIKDRKWNTQERDIYADYMRKTT